MNRKTDSSHKARKRFGQNFLQDPNIIHSIIQSLNPQKEDRVIEIGPGLGALTRPLLESLNTLTVIELDRDLVKRLHEWYKECSDSPLNIIEADALSVNFTTLAGRAHLAPPPIRIIGNLPYNISTPILFHLLEHRAVISDMHFMLQKEVVDRMAARPGCKQYGRLSVMLQYCCEVTHMFDVPPHAFSPPPKVNSGIVRLIPYSTLPHTAKAPEQLNLIVTTAFNQRRKVIRNSLSKIASEAQISAAGIDPNARPEALSVHDFVQLSNALTCVN